MPLKIFHHLFVFRNTLSFCVATLSLDSFQSWLIIILVYLYILWDINVYCLWIVDVLFFCCQVLNLLCIFLSLLNCLGPSIKC